MNIEDVIKACGPLPQAPKVIPSSNKKGNGLILVVVILITGVGYLIYKEWQIKKTLEKQQKTNRTNQ
jgi:hypothetical protein